MRLSGSSKIDACKSMTPGKILDVKKTVAANFLGDFCWCATCQNRSGWRGICVATINIEMLEGH